MIMLLVFVAIGIVVISSVALSMFLSTRESSNLQEGTIAYDIAESGVENAILRLLRNPNYTGETLPVGTGSTTVTVSGTNPKTITSIGTHGNFSRTLQVQVTDVSGFSTITSWIEL